MGRFEVRASTPDARSRSTRKRVADQCLPSARSPSLPVESRAVTARRGRHARSREQEATFPMDPAPNPTDSNKERSEFGAPGWGAAVTKLITLNVQTSPGENKP